MEPYDFIYPISEWPYEQLQMAWLITRHLLAEEFEGALLRLEA